MDRIHNILWDFDGVIMDSNSIREDGFQNVLENYPQEAIDKLIAFHRKNGGLSRYVKFKYFFEEIMMEVYDPKSTQILLESFSALMRKELVNPIHLISETITFIKANYTKYAMHIVSGSDEIELNYLCAELKIADYFISIKGSPVPKNELVENIMRLYKYDPQFTLLIGDSINDYEAAYVNKIKFEAYNNSDLNHLSSARILHV